MRYVAFIFRSLFWNRLRNLFLFGLVAFLWFMLSGLALASVGAPFQFWHDSVSRRILAELAIGGFAGVWTLTVFLLDHGKARKTSEGSWGIEIPSPVSMEDLDLRRLFFRGIVAQASFGFVLCFLVAASSFVFTSQVELSNNYQGGFVMMFFAICWITFGFILFLVLQVISFWIITSEFSWPVLGPIITKIKEVLDRGFQMAWASKKEDEVELEMEQLFHRIAFYTQLLIGFVSFVRVTGYWITSTIDPSNILRADATVGVYICIVLSSAAGIYGFVVFQLRVARSNTFAANYYSLGTLVILGVLLVLIANPIQSQPVRNLTEPRYTTIDEWYNDAEPTTREGIPARSWLDLSSEKKDELTKITKRPLVVIANSGGGIKAQIWSTIVLNAIEQRLATIVDDSGNTAGGSFAEHVRYVTGTSGGMVGAAYWTATLGPPSEIINAEDEDDRRIINHWMYVDNELEGARPLSAEEMIQQMCVDTLTPVARQGFNNDLMGMPINFVWDRLGMEPPLDSRGRALEYSWEKDFSFFDKEGREVRAPSAFNQPFETLDIYEKNEGFEFQTERHPVTNKPMLPTWKQWRPSLIMAPAVAENGRRFMISNADVDYLLVSELGDNHHSISGYSWKSFFGGKGEGSKRLQLSTAARLNANFPFIIDSPTIPLDPPIHILDAGYYDNFGVTLATEWLIRNADTIREMYSGVMFIQISAAPISRATNGVDQPADMPEIPGFVTSSFNKTIYNTDSLIAHLTKEFGGSGDEPFSEDFFEFVTFEYAGPASLSWYVNRAEIYSLLFPLLSSQQLVDGMERSQAGEKAQAFLESTFRFGDAGELFEVSAFPTLFHGEVFTNKQLVKSGEYIFFRQLEDELQQSDQVMRELQKITDSMDRELENHRRAGFKSEKLEEAIAKEFDKKISRPEFLNSVAKTRLQQLVVSRIDIQNELDFLARWWENRIKQADTN